jgi:hypothetical protein
MSFARLASFFLLLESLSTAARTAGRLAVLSIYPWPTLAFIGARMCIAVLQFSSGWMIFTRSSIGWPLGRRTFLISACLVTLELGFGLVPTNLFPTYRWPAVGLYWVYALIGVWMLRDAPGTGDERTRNQGLGTRN